MINDRKVRVRARVPEKQGLKLIDDVYLFDQEVRSGREFQKNKD